MSSHLVKLLELYCATGVNYITLGELEDSGIIKLGRGAVISKNDLANHPGSYPVYSSSAAGSGEFGCYGKFMFEDERISWSIDGGGRFFYRPAHRYSVTNVCGWLKVLSDSSISTRFLFYVLSGAWETKIFDYTKKAHPSIIREEYSVPVPPLEIQAEIVRILDNFTELTAELTAELAARKKQYNYYRDQLLSFEEGEVEWKTLNEVCSSISAGGDLPENHVKGQTEPTDEFPYPIYANATGDKGLYGFTDGYKIESDAVTISARGAKIGYHTVREGKFTSIIRLIALVPNKRVISTRYLNYILDKTPIGGTDGGIPQLTVPTVKKISIPVPEIHEQTRIVAILDKFDALTNSITEGLPREIELRQKQYEYYRDLLLSFPKMEEAAA